MTQNDAAEVVGKLTPDALRRPGLRGSAEARFWSKVEIGRGNECWRWQGAETSRGYGRLSTPVSTSTPAHNVSYVLHCGIIPAGSVVDHICRNRMCVNPAHLRAVDGRTNTIENSDGPTAQNAAKTHCKRGHPLSGPNVRTSPEGWRVCRTCQQAHMARYLANQRALLLKEKPNV